MHSEMLHEKRVAEQTIRQLPLVLVLELITSNNPQNTLRFCYIDAQHPCPSHYARGMDMDSNPRCRYYS